MKSIYFLVTLPLNLISNFFLALNIFQLKVNLDKCIQVIDVEHYRIPDFYTSYLVAAEDHRFRFHYGIDQFGIVRAIFKRLSCSEVQGASTIEQQFVRVVTGDYAYTLKRKFKEQLLAVLLVKKRDKIDIAKAYLAMAYYGHNCEGVKGIQTLIGCDLQFASENQVISIMARLKYPQPSVNSVRWENNISQRISYIKNRHKQAANLLSPRFLRTTD